MMSSTCTLIALLFFHGMSLVKANIITNKLSYFRTYITKAMIEYSLMKSTKACNELVHAVRM